MGSLSVVWKLFACMKSDILDSYCCMGRIIKELPLSVCAIMDSLSFSFVLMLLIVLACRSNPTLRLTWNLPGDRSDITATNFY